MSSPVEIPEKPIRILLVERLAVLRAAIRLLLNNNSRVTVVGQAASGGEAIAEAIRAQPNIIILDLDLGNDSGLLCLPELLRAAPGARVIILTGTTDPSLHQRAVMLGALGLVLKEEPPEVLMEAIEKVHRGEVRLQSAMIARVLEELPRERGARGPAPQHGRAGALTDRERELIPLVGEGLKNRQIAQRLFISEATVRHHLTSIFAKLGVSDRFELLIYAYHHGLARPPEGRMYLGRVAQ